MRQNYCILTTDGESKLWSPIAMTIFWQEDEWTQMSNTVWMPKGCCLAVDSCYFEGLSKDEDAQLKTLFSTRQVVQKFSVSGLYQLLRTRLDDVFAMITTKEISKEFLNFLFKHQTEIFKKGQIESVFKKTPILCKDSNEMSAIENYGGKVYLPNTDALDLYNQPWFNRATMTLCDDFYVDLFDGSERCRFFENLGLKLFRKIHYLRAHLLIHLERMKDNLQDRDNNIAFHRYIADVHDELSNKDLEKVKEMPIYISSPNAEGGVLAEKSANHYIPSELLSDIISKDLVPISILDSIHPDYIISEKDKSYFVDKLSNAEIDEEGFYNYIIKDGVEPEVTSYLNNSERNVRFWRWVCDSKESRENKAKLNILPMLFRYNEGISDGYDVPSKLFISDLYSGVDGLEMFISENVDSPKFISPAYMGEGVDRDWTALFKSLKVTVDYKDIVFKNVLPNLAKYKETKIVGILAMYADIIKQKLTEGEESMRKHLNNLYLKCIDGIYRTPKEVVVSGKFYDVDINPFPDIEINYLVSEEYITCTEDDTQRRNVIKLIVSIGDYYNVKAENATQLRNLKLYYFAKHQDYYAQSEAHYKIIGELAKAYNTDSVGVSDIIRSLGAIKLYTTTGKFINSFGQYLSTIYIPDCQYMANGITELDFVSEKYDEYCPNGLKRMFVYCFNIYDGFYDYNVQLLENERFAFYFWGNYAKERERFLKEIITEENLRNISCIPTTHGMKKPMEVYDYRNSQLLKIVLKLQDGKDKLPTVELPNWVERIGLRGRLYILDCLEYMSLDTHDYRREVIKWIVETRDEILQRHKNAIDKYRESANWFNGAKNWVPLSTLFALEWGNETLKGNFGGNAYVCHPSYMPEYKDDYVRLCKILDIKILTNSDFTKKKAGDCQKDTVAIREISKRLLYLAYKTGKDNWEEIYAGYKEKLDNADISKCERINYFYNEKISTSLRIYCEDATALWYIGDWRGPMFIKIRDWIIKKIEVKGNFDTDFMDNLFLDDFATFIKQQEGGSLPTVLLAHLDEAERAGIDVDESVNADVFTEDVNDVNSLPEYVKQQAGISMEQRQNQVTEDTEEPECEEQVSSHANMEDDVQPATERKRRSDLGGTHLRRKPSTRESVSDEPHPASSYSGGSDREEPQAKEQKSFTERLKEKWNKEKNAPVQKPHSAKPADNVDVFNSPNTSSSTESKEEFFDEDINTVQYTQRTNTTFDSNLLSSRHNRDNFNNKQKAAQEELDKAKDQADLDDAIARTKKYSFLWFKYLMAKLYNQKNDTVGTRSVQIDFKEAKVLDDYTIAILRPNRVVPKWIEYADDITLHILKNNDSEKIVINLQYFTEDAIWAFYENTSELEIKINEADKIRIVANGYYANHIDSFTKQFVKLDLPDDYSLRDNLPNSIKYIYGPPGTGKTTRLVSKIQAIIQNCETDLDVLVLTPTNKAADVIAARLSDNDTCTQYTYRFGVTENLEFLGTNKVYTRDDEFIEYKGHHVVVTTAARYAYDYLMPNEEVICDHHWDYVIVDEASMMDIVTMAFILFKSKDCQFIISGDPKQIQPVRQNEVQPENIYQMVGLNSFAAAQNNPKVECLNTQYRSIPTIGDLVSKFSYNGIVKPNRTQSSQKPLNLGFKISSINYLGFKTELLDNLYGLDAIDESAFHLYSVIFGYEYASYIASKIKESSPSKPYSIGIVCPYKKQADSIKQMIELRDISNDSCKVHCGTVHSFQGDECDIMIVVLNPPMNVTQNSHVNNHNIINVAVSRAKDYIFFLVPNNRTPDFPTREVLGKMSGDEKNILFCDKIEKIMFGQEDYIQQHTNVTCHMPVNVYYEPSSLYEVRKDDKAVDIQINERFR
ncbi:MAG: AAA domain-containing protein [Parabacteroides sp.]|nr:AAA domain-containing protein [Parabacteroides sp.]